MKTWNRFQSPALWAIAVVLGAPAWASAQQSGMFPLAPIQRERVPCPLEDPVYGLYRHEYFGYHPTCWRRFPAGWGCPTPEAPDVTAAFLAHPRDKPPPLSAYPPEGETPSGDELPAPLPSPTAPAPGGRGRGPARERDRGNTTPGGMIPPLPSGERSPFDLDTNPTPPRGASSGPAPRLDRAPMPGSNDAGVPSLPPPLRDSLPSPREAPGRPGAIPGLPPLSRSNAPVNSPLPPPGIENRPPVLALPDTVNAGPPLLPASNPGPSAGDPTMINPDPNLPQAPLTPAPRRTSLIGGLINNLKRR